MSKLKDLMSRGVRLIVTDGPDESAPDAPAPGRELPAEVFEPPPPPRATRSEVPADVTDFGAVYAEAAIELPLHGYGVDKVGEMLESKRLATLGREVKATAVLAALEAAGVPLRDVIQDAVKRDNALDSFESSKEQEIRELQAKSEGRIEAIKEEIAGFLREKNAEIDGLKLAAEAATRAFAQLQARKRKEEDRLHSVVSHFIEAGDNPITTSAAAAAPPTPPKPGQA